MFEFGASIWYLLVLLGAMIIIHELGHYWMARLFDVRVDAFSVGFGPRLFGFKVGETDFKFCLILFGGYVKMSGDVPGEEAAADPRSFLAKPRWQRFLIAFAGPLMNILLAIAILTGLYMNQFQRVPQIPSPTVGYVDAGGPVAKAGVQEGDKVVEVDGIVNPTWKDITLREFEDTNRAMSLVVERNGERKSFEIPLPANERTQLGDGEWMESREIRLGGFARDGESPAEKAGLKVGDTLAAVNGQPVRSIRHLNRALTSANGQPVEITYSRSGTTGVARIQPVWKKPDESQPERWMIGIRMEEALEVTQLSFPEALRESVAANIEGAGMVFRFLKGLVERRLSAKTLDGPIGMAGLAKSAAREGYFLPLMQMVSLQLAVFNLLPIPILDGGMMLMLLIEMIRRQDLSLKFKESVLKVGFAFLMMVAVFVIYNDISKKMADNRTPVPASSSSSAPTK